MRLNSYFKRLSDLNMYVNPTRSVCVCVRCWGIQWCVNVRCMQARTCVCTFSQITNVISVVRGSGCVYVLHACVCTGVCFTVSYVTNIILAKGSGDVPVCEYVCLKNRELHMNLNQRACRVTFCISNLHLSTARY